MPHTPVDNNLTTVIVVGGCVIKKDNKFLLVQEKLPEVYSKWNLPAGKVEKGNTIEETAITEAKEETGFDVKLIKKIGIFHGDQAKAVKHVFKAEIISGKLNYDPDEILDAKWFTLEEIKKMKDKLREPWVLEAIEKSYE